VNIREVLNAVFLRAVDGVPVEGSAEGPAAAQHGLGLPRPVGLGWHVEPHPSCPVCRSARGGRPGRQPDNGHHQQPEREGSPQRASLDPSGYDAGKKVKGRKRPTLTDTLGLLLAVVVYPASVQDRDGAEILPREARRTFPSVERVIGDAGYQGRKMEAALARTGAWTLQIVRRCNRHRFVVLPKRWIIERTLAWISRNRRLVRDYERHARKAAAFVRLAMIRLMLRRLASNP
jgi:transposase